MARKKTEISPQFRQEILRQLRAGGFSLTEASDASGVSRKTLAAWLHESNQEAHAPGSITEAEVSAFEARFGRRIDLGSPTLRLTPDRYPLDESDPDLLAHDAVSPFLEEAGVGVNNYPKDVRHFVLSRPSMQQWVMATPGERAGPAVALMLRGIWLVTNPSRDRGEGPRYVNVFQYATPALLSLACDISDAQLIRVIEASTSGDDSWYLPAPQFVRRLEARATAAPMSPGLAAAVRQFMAHLLGPIKSGRVSPAERYFGARVDDTVARLQRVVDSIAERSVGRSR